MNMTLLAATGESVTVKDMLIAFTLIGPTYTAIAWYSIRKTLASTARYSRDGLIAKWMGAFMVSAFILVASAYAGGGYALIGVLIAVLVPGSIILALILTPYIQIGWHRQSPTRWKVDSMSIGRNRLMGR